MLLEMGIQFEIDIRGGVRKGKIFGLHTFLDISNISMKKAIASYKIS